MAVESYAIQQFSNKDGTPIYPITTSKALIGSISSRSYNINDSNFLNNWNRVVDTGFYIDEITTGVTGTGRPPETDNTYGDNCCIKVTNNRSVIIQETNYPGANPSNPITFGSVNIVKNYYRTGVPTYSQDGSISSIDWKDWNEIVSGGSGSGVVDDGSLD